jgi:hypothetical protein
MGVYSENRLGDNVALLGRRSWTASMCLAAILVPFISGCSPTDDTPPITHATSAIDAAERRIACLQDRGWKATLSEDNGVQASVPNEQLDMYQKDVEECGEGLLPDKTAFTQDQWSRAYELANETADCLAELGYEGKNRPSLQAFIESNGDWSVYADLLDQGIILHSDLSTLTASCPQAEYWG